MAQTYDDQPLRPLTDVLTEVNGGDANAFGELVERVYPELRVIAEGRMRRSFHQPIESLTRSPSAIVNEAVIRLMHQRSAWQNPEHFFAIAARLLVNVILDYQEHRLAEKRGGGRRGRSLSALSISADGQGPIDPRPEREARRRAVLEALDRLHGSHPEEAEVVTLALACGLTQERIGEMIGKSVPTVKRLMASAREHLRAELEGPGT